MEGSSSTAATAGGAAAAASIFFAGPPLDANILKKLHDGDSSVREKCLVTLKNLAEQNAEFKVYVCRQRILEVVVSMLGPGRHPELIREATALIAILSEEPSNITKIVPLGITPRLLIILRDNPALAGLHAARALSRLASTAGGMDVTASTAVISLVFDRFCGLKGEAHKLRDYAGRALCELTYNSPGIASRFLKIAGAVPKLLVLMEVRANSSKARNLAHLATVVVSHLAWDREVRKALIEAGAVAKIVGMLRNGTSANRAACLAMMYQIWACDSNQSLFKRLAKEAGASAVLSQDMEHWGDVGRRMAKMMLDFINKKD